MTTTATTVAVDAKVTAEIDAAFALLVEVPGETREVRYTRLTRVVSRLYNVQAGYQPWSAESHALTDAAVRCHRFQMFGK